MKIKQIKKLLEESEWKLGILLNGYDDLKANRVKWISNGIYKNKWFADPFILDFDDKKITLLVEEFDYSIHRGRIARLVIDRNSWTITDCKIILDLGTHLSFPMEGRLARIRMPRELPVRRMESIRVQGKRRLARIHQTNSPRKTY